MADSIRIATIALAGVSLLALPTATPGQAGKTPKSVAMCLPPGATAPIPCGTARAGQTIRLQVATTSLPTGPINLQFTEEVATGQAPRMANLTIPPAMSRDGGYEVTVPSALCSTGRDRMGNFEIQHLMSTFNEGETTPFSLGTMTIAC
jgi:hypothetical protein